MKVKDLLSLLQLMPISLDANLYMEDSERGLVPINNLKLTKIKDSGEHYDYCTPFEECSDGDTSIILY
jgi:hypothetical protein